VQRDGQQVKGVDNAGTLVSPFASVGDAIFAGDPLLGLASGVAQRSSRLMRFARSSVAASTGECVGERTLFVAVEVLNEPCSDHLLPYTRD
jgi:hypothetical protein